MREALTVAAFAAATACGNVNGVGTAAATSTGGSVGTSMAASAGTSGTTVTASTAAASSSSGAVGTSGTAGTTGTSTSGFVTAPHQPLPIVAYQGGPVLATVDIVTISFADVQMNLSDYTDALLASGWFAAVGAEYGISAGQHLANYVVPDGGPSAVADSDIQAFLAGLIDAGTVPPPTSSTLYAIEYPQETTVSLSPTDISCQQIGGYHNFDPSNAAVYAVIGNCPLSLDSQEGFTSTVQSDQFYMSHEFLEAATDPAVSVAPAYTFNETEIASLPWLFTTNTELADLCVTTPPVTLDAGLIATRIWSNAAADAGLANPCVPSPAGEVYFTVSPALADGGLDPAVAIAAANQSQPQTFTFTLTGWSTGPIADWSVFVEPGQGSFTPGVVLSNAPQGFTTLNNGQTATLSVTVPAQTAANNAVGLALYSSNAAMFPHVNVAAVAVYVQ